MSPNSSNIFNSGLIVFQHLDYVRRKLRICISSVFSLHELRSSETESTHMRAKNIIPYYAVREKLHG